MKTINNIIRKTVWAASAVLVMASCNDAWNDHYSINPDVPSKTIAEAIEGDDNYSKFVEVLSSTLVYDGNKKLAKTYLDLLNESQFFTIWLPSDNSISPERWEEYTMDIDDPKKDHKKIGEEFIKNHIAHFKHDVSAVTNEKIVMLSNKAFRSGHDNIDDVQYLKTNIRCVNGIIHEIDGELEYRPNIYEVLTKSESTWENFRKWFAKYTKMEIDTKKSIASGINQEGKMEYVDSVLVEKSILLDYFGKVNGEDSDFVVILPSPALFKEMYDSISGFFEYGSQIESRDSLQEYWTFRAMMTDMFFNMNPVINVAPDDSVVSTRFSIRERRTEPVPYHVYYNPKKAGGLFANIIDTIRCSNGSIYVVDQWPFEDSLTFRRPIKLEAENQRYDSKVVLQDKRIISSSVSVMDVTVTGKNDWSITYYMKDNLKGWYNVKIVFYAQNMTAASKPYSVAPTVSYRPDKELVELFNSIQYVNIRGRLVPTLVPFDVCTNNQKIDTLTVGPVNFGTCNYMTNSNRVEIALKCGASLKPNPDDYSWKIGIDCIILEPASEPAVSE